jgi:hypothetical protein
MTRDEVERQGPASRGVNRRRSHAGYEIGAEEDLLPVVTRRTARRRRERRSSGVRSRRHLGRGRGLRGWRGQRRDELRGFVAHQVPRGERDGLGSERAISRQIEGAMHFAPVRGREDDRHFAVGATAHHDRRQGFARFAAWLADGDAERVLQREAEPRGALAVPAVGAERNAAAPRVGRGRRLVRARQLRELTRGRCRVGSGCRKQCRTGGGEIDRSSQHRIVL